MPKFIGTIEQAHEANLKVFIGTLNRTIGADLWGRSISDGKGGSIKGYTQYNKNNFSKLSDIPKEINISSINFGNCGDGNSSLAHFADANITVTGREYYIICRDGNVTNPPIFSLYKGNNCIAGVCN